jgi:hypothetical protein
MLLGYASPNDRWSDGKYSKTVERIAPIERVEPIVADAAGARFVVPYETGVGAPLVSEREKPDEDEEEEWVVERDVCG